MKTISWPQALVVATALIVLGILALAHADLLAYVGAVGALLLALGIGHLQTIRDQTNGNNTAQLKMIADQNAASNELMRVMAAQLAASMPPLQIESGRDQSPSP